MIAETETTARLLGDSELVTGGHLDLDTEGDSVVDGLLGVLARRVVDGEETDELEAVARVLLVARRHVLHRDRERTQTAAGKLLDIVLELVLELGRLVARAEFDDDTCQSQSASGWYERTSHALGHTLHLTIGILGVGDLGALVDRVEGLKLDELDAGAGLGDVAEGADDAAVDGVLVLRARGVGGEQADGVDVVGRVRLDRRLVDRELVGRERARLVCAASEAVQVE